jgi:hypothetical protein
MSVGIDVNSSTMSYNVKITYVKNLNLLVLDFISQ